MGTDAAGRVLADMVERFPAHDLLDALTMLEPHFWMSEVATQPPVRRSAASLNVFLRTLQIQYCKEKPLGEGTGIAAALISHADLTTQFPAFKVIMRLVMPTVTARHQAAVAKCNASIAVAKEQGRVHTGNMK